MLNRTLIIGSLVAAIAGGQAAAQVIGSPHDMTFPTAEDNGEVCVYCHTPHGGRTDITAPLWNKPSTGQTYQIYDSTTADGDVLAVGSVSVACLTCHDGTQAMDAVLNEPGSGAGDGDLGPLGIMPPNSAAVIGTDLRDDHPIGVQYGGFNPGTGVIDADFKTAELKSETVGLTTRWWVDTAVGTADKLEKTDMLLYTRNNPNGGVDQPFVECASCHDPHEGGGSPHFMRIPNTNSEVCFSCHVK